MNKTFGFAGFRRTSGNKYGNNKCVYDGKTFDSQKERDRYIFLRGAEECGEIRNLRTQVKYELIPAIFEQRIKHLKTKDKYIQACVQKAVTYKADFVYECNGNVVVEDVKASPSFAALDKAFLLKEKMMRYFHNITIKRVYKPTESL